MSVPPADRTRIVTINPGETVVIRGGQNAPADMHPVRRMDRRRTYAILAAYHLQGAEAWR
jgi:hypothetical protein